MKGKQTNRALAPRCPGLTRTSIFTFSLSPILKYSLLIMIFLTIAMQNALSATNSFYLALTNHDPVIRYLHAGLFGVDYTGEILTMRRRCFHEDNY